MTELTIKQEKFAQKYIELGNASEAYRQSYDCVNSNDKTIWEEASRTLANPEVTARVKELIDANTQKHFVTVDTLTNEYEEIRNAALQEKQFSPAVAAVTGKAKLHGHLSEKVEHTGKDGGPIETKDISGIEAAKRIMFTLEKAARAIEEE